MKKRLTFETDSNDPGYQYDLDEFVRLISVDDCYGLLWKILYEDALELKESDLTDEQVGVLYKKFNDLMSDHNISLDFYR